MALNVKHLICWIVLFSAKYQKTAQKTCKWTGHEEHSTH